MNDVTGKDRKQHLHFVGIGGSGISSVAQLAYARGYKVTGCDQFLTPMAHSLIDKGIQVSEMHSPDHLTGVDTLVLTPAILALDAQNPEVKAAKERGLNVINWQQMLGEFMSGKLGISVAGVHGKGTTTAMLSLMLIEAGLDPTCEIGGVVPAFHGNIKIGNSDLFVNEADEYNHNFWHYHPRMALITYIEYEHPEFFKDYESFLYAFEHFIAGMDLGGKWTLPPTLILNQDSKGCLELRDRLPSGWQGTIKTFGTGRDADYYAEDINLQGETSFRVMRGEKELGRFNLQLPGRHNIQNALGAIAAADQLGVPVPVMQKVLGSFTGVQRRFEIRNPGEAVVFIDDYAHHPTAIAATIEAAKGRFSHNRIVAVYQPHMYSRTKTFFNDYITAFDQADQVVISDIFPAREHDTGLIHSNELVKGIQRRPAFTAGGRTVQYGGNLDSTIKVLQQTLQSGDIVVVMGAGDIYKVTNSMLDFNRTSLRK